MIKEITSREDFLRQDDSYAVTDPETGRIIEFIPREKSQTIFYTTHCPQCYGLENLLKMYKINYKTIDDLDLIRSKGFLSVPMLEIDNQTLNYKEALVYIRRNY